VPYANKEKEKVNRKASREANKEKKVAQQKVWQKANKEKIVAREKAYREANPEKQDIKHIKQRLSESMQIPTTFIPPELIEAKLMQLKVIRLLRDTKKKTPV